MYDTEIRINESAELDKGKAEKPTEDKPTAEQEFLSALKFLQKGYLWALGIAAAIMIGGIICAVHYRVSFGALIMVLAVVTYLAIVINLLYIKLGIAYRSFHGGMTITALYGKHREIIYIPDKVIMLTVSEIGNRAFTHNSSKSIREIHLPKTIQKIGKSAFASLPALTDVYFEGTEEEWERISRFAPLENVTMHFEQSIPRIEKQKRQKKAKIKQKD